jgi:DNA-binding MarR family transcriptional regulator
MDVLQLNRLARLLREVALKASQNGQELPISASELAVIEDVARHPDITISEISHDTGLAQSRVSTIVRDLTSEGVLVQRKVPPDRRQTRVRLDPKAESQTFDEFGARPVDDVLSGAVPHLSPDEVAHLLLLLEEVLQMLDHPREPAAAHGRSRIARRHRLAAAPGNSSSRGCLANNAQFYVQPHKHKIHLP